MIDIDMNSFSDFLNERLDNNVSQESQIAQYERSLNSLMKIRKKLVADGMSTVDIDSQMTELHKSLGRRKSGVHKWYGSIVRIDQEPINNQPMWRLMGRDGIAFHIPVGKTVGIVKIPNHLPSEKKPISKFIEYRDEILGHSMVKLITYTENRTVDIVPFRTHMDKSEFYLIKRRSGLWATVGGHIDEGELDTPIISARRELEEETRAQPLAIRQIPMGWIREVVTNPEATPSVEYNSWTLPFIALIDPKFEMEPSDDAQGGQWFATGDIPVELHFRHHKKIINGAFKYLPKLLKEFGKHQTQI